MMRQDYYMDRIDLTDAYYSVPIGFSDFEWMKYKYECMLNGLSSAPRIPAKFLKPVLSALRKHGHQAINYLDNSFLVGDKFEKYLSSGRLCRFIIKTRVSNVYRKTCFYAYSKN